MAKISLHGSTQNSATSVSNVFIDEYMSDANGEFVKIYLYLLRMMNAPDTAFSLSSIADKFEHTEKDVKRALCYWERMHLLRLEYDDTESLTGICLLDSFSRDPSSAALDSTLASAPVPAANAGTGTQNPASVLSQPHQTAAAMTDTTIQKNTGVMTDTAIPQNVGARTDAAIRQSAGMMEDAAIPQNTGATSDAAIQKNAAVSVADTNDTTYPGIPEKKSYSADDIRKFRQEEAVAEIFFLAEQYLGRTLNATDINTFLYLYDSLHFSAELIEYLVEYCVSKKHTSIRYIEKVALGWADNQITTVAEAKQTTSLRSQSHTTVMRALGISGRNLVPAETAYIEKWKSQYGFTDELIGEACQRTITAIHQPSFEYVDSILSRWHKKQIRNLNDIARLDDEHHSRKKNDTQTASAKSAAPNKFNNFAQRSYDYDQLEQMLLTTSVH